MSFASRLAVLAFGVAGAASVAACSKGEDEAAAAETRDPMCPAPEEGAPAEVPDDLRCTGLYARWDDKTIATENRAFAPASPLWSDGAEKRRWIQLPEGTTIDASKMDDWTFPVGTKTWKEFVVDGRKIETRFMWKVRADRWLQASYVWSEDGTRAVRGEGSEVAVGGRTWSVPKTGDCNSCHEGRKDKVLGFEAVNLALPGATGLTLEALAAEKRLAPAPARTSVTIADDGTGHAASALAYLHTNCGVSCHGPNDGAIGGRVGLRLRLGWDELTGGKALEAWDTRATTLGVAAKGADWDGKLRVAPGDPAASLLVDLVETRGPGQMPKVGSAVVDRAGVDGLRAWIAALGGKALAGTSPSPATPADPSTCQSPEAEGNETPDTATTMPGASGSACGAIGAEGDVDHVAFVAPATFAGISLKLRSSDDAVKAVVTANDGAPVELGTGAPVPAVKGARYVVKVSGPVGATWTLALTFR